MISAYEESDRLLSGGETLGKPCRQDALKAKRYTSNTLVLFITKTYCMHIRRLGGKMLVLRKTNKNKSTKDGKQYGTFVRLVLWKLRLMQFGLVLGVSCTECAVQPVNIFLVLPTMGGRHGQD